MYGLCTTKPANWSRLLRSLPIAVATISILLVATNAKAACGDPRAYKSTVVPKMPILAHLDSGATTEHGNPNDNSIVGLWHVTYTAGGQLFYDAFDEWHADGTEFENANVPPIGGNVCVGVWTTRGKQNVRLNHIGWVFDSNGNSAGTFTLTETNRLGANGLHYTGTFDYRLYDVNGKLLGEVKGTQKATRISVK